MALAVLEQSQFYFHLVAEGIEVPWGIEGEFDIDRFDVLDVTDHLFDFHEHVFGFGTVGGGHGHEYFDVQVVVDVDVVDEAEVVDVDGYLGVVDVFEAVDDCVFDGFFVELLDWY